MFSFLNFWKKPVSQNLEYRPYCFVGVYAPVYGADYDIEGLCQGTHDELFKKNYVAFAYCSIFETLEEAVKVMERRGVTDNSSFIVVVASAAHELRSLVKERNFSELILGYINARLEPHTYTKIAPRNLSPSLR